jgi:DNA processing protein
MDLLSAVAVSMLPVSRGRAAGVYKELRQQNSAVSVGDVLEALRIEVSRVAELEREAHASAQHAIAAAASAGIEPVPWFDARYPALLNCVSDPPPVLWVRGRVDVLERPSVAIVGSRAATNYALDVGRRLAAELAGRGLVVCSGLARGVDSAAHRGCLDTGGATVAVLGSGVDRIYPSEHEELAEQIAADGAIVSELGPGGAPLPEHFPLRNRIISGMSLAVVVVEANEKSGSLITARCALEQGRDVMAVPGSVLSGRNRGSHSLLKDGAKVVETADDILEELGWVPSAFRQTREADRTRVETDPLLARMDPGEEYQLDVLVATTGLGPARLLTRLMELELQGQIVTAGAGRFTRLVR